MFVKNADAFKKYASTLRVMARSCERYWLVVGLENMGKIVAVTVEGEDDIESLERASAGISKVGEYFEECEKAAGIITLRDSFADIAAIATHEK